MRLLHCIHSLKPESGGPAHFVRSLAEAGPRFGIESAVVCLDAPDTDYSSSHDFPVQALGPGLFKYGLSGRFFAWLKAHGRDFDLVAIHGLWQFASWGTCLALAGGQTRYVVFPHGMLDPWFQHRYPLKHLKKALYWRCAEASVLAGAATVIYTAEEERQKSRAAFRPYLAQEAVVPLGVPEPPPAARSQVDSFLEAVPALKGREFLLFLGRIHEKKGVDILIDAFAAAAGRHRDLCLLVAGPLAPDCEPSLERKLAAAAAGPDSRVFTTGMLTGEAKWGALRSASALVLPSHQENFGLVVAEALACRLPVLMSTGVDIWREVEEGGAAITATDDQSGTLDMIERWQALGEPERQRMRDAAAGLFAERYSIGSALGRLAPLLKSLASADR